MMLDRDLVESAIENLLYNGISREVIFSITSTVRHVHIQIKTRIQTEVRIRTFGSPLNFSVTLHDIFETGRNHAFD